MWRRDCCAPAYFHRHKRQSRIIDPSIRVRLPYKNSPVNGRVTESPHSGPFGRILLKVVVKRHSKKIFYTIYFRAGRNVRVTPLPAVSRAPYCRTSKPYPRRCIRRGWSTVLRPATADSSESYGGPAGDFPATRGRRNEQRPSVRFLTAHTVASRRRADRAVYTCTRLGAVHQK